MGDMMDRFFGSDRAWWPNPTEGFAPKTDLVETEKQFEVTADLPGLKPEEVNVEMREGSLWITGERCEEKEEEGKTYHRVERHSGKFRRVISLPTPVDKQHVTAEFEDGVLKVVIPKAKEDQPRKIAVKSNGKAK
jgi:HSP20 family protein